MQTFVAEIDGIPVIAFQAKNKAEARAFVERRSMRKELRALKYRGMRLWHETCDLRVRAATRSERRQLTMAMLSIGLMAKRIDLNFWASLISTQL